MIAANTIWWKTGLRDTALKREVAISDASREARARKAQYALSPGEKRVKGDKDRDDSARPRALEAEAGLQVKEHGATVRSDVYHGELVGELRFVLQGCVEYEASESYERETLLQTAISGGDTEGGPLSAPSILPDIAGVNGPPSLDTPHGTRTQA